MSKQTAQSIFNLTDYRVYVQSWAQARGRGEFRRISLALGMHTTLVSQIFNNKKCLTEEQATSLCSYMGLNSLETDYFLKLVQLERAGTQQLKSVFKRHLKQIQNYSNVIKSRVPESEDLSESDRAIFYSSWQYSLIRLLTSIPQFQFKEKIAFHLGLSVSRVQEILDFLTSRGLCKEERGRYHRTGKNTHIEATSPLSIRHHQNWRTKSLELIERITLEDLSFTAPISLSPDDIPKIRRILLEAISEISKLVENSASEEVAYLGIDWIKM
ncbi:MAG: TIGR02147 family protein [Bdellovibrionaceae bacterium]|nr:TIGR02147 family protein [Pseudobdellovibrionaceae bacterium]